MLPNSNTGALKRESKTFVSRDESIAGRRCEVIFVMTDGNEQSFAGTYHQSAFDEDSVVVEFDDGEVQRVKKYEVICDGKYMTIKKTTKKANVKSCMVGEGEGSGDGGSKSETKDSESDISQSEAENILHGMGHTTLEEFFQDIVDDLNQPPDNTVQNGNASGSAHHAALPVYHGKVPRPVYHGKVPRPVYHGKVPRPVYHGKVPRSYNGNHPEESQNGNASGSAQHGAVPIYKGKVPRPVYHGKAPRSYNGNHSEESNPYSQTDDDSGEDVSTFDLYNGYEGFNDNGLPFCAASVCNHFEKINTAYKNKESGFIYDGNVNDRLVGSICAGKFESHIAIYPPRSKKTHYVNIKYMVDNFTKEQVNTLRKLGVNSKRISSANQILKFFTFISQMPSTSLVED
jgi:hypothetical protein